MNMETKVCTKCDVEKSLDDFHKGRGCCKLCRKEYDKIKYLNNIDKYRKYSRDRYNENPEYWKKWVSDNPEKMKEVREKYYKNNREKQINSVLKSRSKNVKRYNEYMVSKRNDDPIFKLSFNVRKRLNKFLKINNITKNNKTFEIVGCNPKFLKEYLEKQFKDDMSWDNYGKWHIDHIIPLSSSKTEEEIYQLSHYTNLQPLWAEDNLKKGNKILKTI